MWDGPEGKELEAALEKVVPQFIADRAILNHCGCTDERADEIIRTGQVPLELLQMAGTLHGFDGFPDRFDITEREGSMLRSYFQHDAASDPWLTETFPYITK